MPVPEPSLPSLTDLLLRPEATGADPAVVLRELSDRIPSASHIRLTVRHDDRPPREVASIGAPTGHAASALTVPIALAPAQRAAVELASTSPDAFGDADVQAVADLSPWLALVAHRHLHRHDVDNLQAALASSRTIGTAIGMLMVDLGIGADRAFELLQGTSQDLNLKLRDVAEQLVSQGSLPGSRHAAR